MWGIYVEVTGAVTVNAYDATSLGIHQAFASKTIKEVFGSHCQPTDCYESVLNFLLMYPPPSFGLPNYG